MRAKPATLLPSVKLPFLLPHLDVGCSMLDVGRWVARSFDFCTFHSFTSPIFPSVKRQVSVLRVFNDEICSANVDSPILLLYSFTLSLFCQSSKCHPLPSLPSCFFLERTGSFLLLCRLSPAQLTTEQTNVSSRRTPHSDANDPHSLISYGRK